MSIFASCSLDSKAMDQALDFPYLTVKATGNVIIDGCLLESFTCSAYVSTSGVVVSARDTEDFFLRNTNFANINLQLGRSNTAHGVWTEYTLDVVVSFVIFDDLTEIGAISGRYGISAFFLPSSFSAQSANC
jgi:hypothetical protein